MSDGMNYFIFMSGSDIVALAEAMKGAETIKLLQDHSDLQAWSLPKVVYDYVECLLDGAALAGEINMIEHVALHYRGQEPSERWSEHAYEPEEAQPDSEGATGEDKGPGATQHD